MRPWRELVAWSVLSVLAERQTGGMTRCGAFVSSSNSNLFRGLRRSRSTQGIPLTVPTTRASSTTATSTVSSSAVNDRIRPIKPIFLPSAMSGNRQLLRVPPRGGASPLSSARKVSALSTASAAPAAEADSSITSDGDRDSFDDAAWLAPPPTQTYVALAKNGQRYDHSAVNGGAARIRVVVSDLDGTLLGPDKEVSATTREAVRRARAKGVTFVPASGRSKAGMFSAMGELGEDLKRDGAPIVCMNGLTVYGQGDGDHGDIIHSTTMCPKLATRVVEFWRKHPLAAAAGVSLCGSEGDTIVVEKLDDRTKSFVNHREPHPKEVGDFDDAIASGMELNRLYFWGPTRAAVNAFKDDLDEHLKDHPNELTRGIPEMIEVLPPGASKAVGLDALLKDLGVSPEEVVTLGDEENDIEMLRFVGHGVAMGQASLEVRKAARYTAPTNALHGVAIAIKTFCGV